MSQPQNRTLVTVRRATQADVVAACEVVRRSIQVLCIADHQNDQPTLAAWLENKTEPFFKRSIDAQSQSSVVAIRENQVCGFGQINHTGEIGLVRRAGGTVHRRKLDDVGMAGGRGSSC